MTSILSNPEIDDNVKLIVGTIVEQMRIRDEDQPVVTAFSNLVINVLQNLNDIAFALDERRQWEENQRS